MSVLAVQAPTAATDWTGLNHKAAGFTTLTSDTDPVTGTVSIVFSGLEVRLSDVLAQAAGKPVSGVTIYADTLTADVDAVSAESLIVVARSVDVSALDDGLLQITAPASGEVVAEWLVGASLNGALTIASSTAAGDAVPQRVPAGTDPLRALLCQFSADGTANSQTLTDAASLTDLTGRAWALGSLRASCTAGAQLMTSRSADDRAVAQSMFSWIVSCVGALALDGGTVPADAVELYNQAGALLVTLDVAPGGFFVPVLSGQVYETEIGALLGALAGYEAGLDTLATRTDIAAAVASVSSTLQVTASAELAPLQTQLQNVRDNVASLYLGFAELRSDFALQADQSNTDYLHLAATVKNAEMAQFVQDAISTAMSVVSLGVAVAKGSQGDVGSVTDGMNSLSAGVTSGIQVLDDLAMVPPGGEGLVAQAKQLMQMQLALMTSFQSATILWSQSQDGTGGSPLPSSLGVVDIDPSLAWENFLAQAQATLTTVKEHIGSGAGSQAAQDAANAYLASLQILAGYGKAIDGKFAAYSSQTAQATLLSAQLGAAKTVVASWQAQAQEAKSDEERLGILRSVLQSRADALKRSIYVAWTYYRASYFYLHLTEPPVSVDVGMTSAQLKDAFVSVSIWMAQLLGTAPDNQHVVLPSEDVAIAFSFAVRTAGSTDEVVAPGAGVALLTPASGTAPASIAWTIPIGDPQLDGVLPDGRDVAIWITGIEFKLDGVTPNNKGNVLVSVASSGTYENGFGPSNAHTFFSKGLVGDYGYTPATNTVYIPWKIPTAVYMTPTPYTQWNMTFDPAAGGDPSHVTRLHMTLTAAYLRQGSGGDS